MSFTPSFNTKFNIGSASAGGVPVSSEVQAALDLLPNPDLEDNAKLSAIIDPAVISGEWAALDYLMIHAMADADNALTNIAPAGGAKVMTNVNASTFTAGEGYTFNGTTQYLNTNIVPFADGIKAVQNDFQAECFVRQNLESILVTATLFGCEDGTKRITHLSFNEGVGSNMVVKCVNNASITNDTYDEYTDGKLYGMMRSAFNVGNFMYEGASIKTDSTSSSALPNDAIYIGCRNDDGSAEAFINVQVAFFMYSDKTSLTSIVANIKTQYSL